MSIVFIRSNIYFIGQYFYMFFICSSKKRNRRKKSTVNGTDGDKIMDEDLDEDIQPDGNVNLNIC